MSLIVRIPKDIHDQLMADLRRPHSFAMERVAFCHVAIGNKGGEPTLILATEPWSIPDQEYVDDPMSGARIDRHAIRGALQRILKDGRGVLHVHAHDLAGPTDFGTMDMEEIPRLVQSFRNANPTLPHGMLVLGRDSARAAFYLPSESTLRFADQISIVGWPTTIYKSRLTTSNARYARQGFLGPKAEEIINSTRVGIVGLGGGGSHIAQQLAHLGFRDFVLYDDQAIDETNLNRLVGATEADTKASTQKVLIAERVIKGIRASATVKAVPQRWQDNRSPLRSCDMVFGCVDGFDERRQLEITCRRYYVPYIDIGMDVHAVAGQTPRMVGQIIVSVPGWACMQCLGFLNELTLAREAQNYGQAGDRPQVVWSNGVLASTAVGLGIDLLTDWTRQRPDAIYLSYDGNASTVTPHVRLRFVRKQTCPHHRFAAAGDPVL
jgi:ThiF family